MAADLADHLQSSLGSSFTIVRELGGGGMSYAFVAAIWANADPQQLKDGAQEAVEALKRLDADGRLRAQLGSANKP